MGMGQAFNFGIKEATPSSALTGLGLYGFTKGLGRAQMGCTAHATSPHSVLCEGFL
jgi:hypothetical protein